MSDESSDCINRPHPSPAGFTLIEVMVVIVILGVLAALVVPRILSRPDEARVVAAKQDIAVIGQALPGVCHGPCKSPAESR